MFKAIHHVAIICSDYQILSNPYNEKVHTIIAQSSRKNRETS